MCVCVQMQIVSTCVQNVCISANKSFWAYVCTVYMEHVCMCMCKCLCGFAFVYARQTKCVSASLCMYVFVYMCKY